MDLPDAEHDGDQPNEMERIVGIRPQLTWSFHTKNGLLLSGSGSGFAVMRESAMIAATMPSIFLGEFGFSGLIGRRLPEASDQVTRLSAIQVRTGLFPCSN